MNKLEIACVIIGFICIILNIDFKAEGKTAIICVLISKVISNLIFGAMILLPLYFNYWR
jgi:hypothetical protein